MLDGFRERISALQPKSRVGRGVVTLASGTAIAQLITICAMPFVTRLYTPAQIGVISLFLAFFGFWASTLSLRYEYALLIAKDDAESHVVFRLALGLVLVMAVLALPVLWALQRTATLGFGLLPAWAPVVAVPILFGYGIFMVYRSWALRGRIVAQITKATIARAGANAVTRVVLGLLGGGVAALFAAEVVGAWGGMLGLMGNVRAHFSSTKPQHVNLGVIARTGRKFIKFPLFETPSAWIDQLATALPLTIMASLHGAAAAGWFGLARMAVSVPNAQIGRAVADVFQMELASAVLQGDTRRAHTLFYKFMGKLALIGVLPLVGAMALAPLVVPWVFGSKWREAGLAAAAIAPWLYGALVISPLSRALSVLQAQQYKLLYDIPALVLLVAAFLLSKAMHYSFIEVVLAVSAAGLVGYVVYASLLVTIVELRLGKVAT